MSSNLSAQKGPIQDSLVQKKILDINIHFKLDDACLSTEYKNNQKELTHLINIIDSIGIEYIDSVVAIVHASPEGGYQYNMKLAERRADTMNKYLTNRRPILVDKFKVYIGGESWKGLRHYVTHDKLLTKEEKEEIINLIDAQMDIALKKRKLSGLSSYDYLINTYYPFLRNSNISIFYHQILIAKAESHKEVAPSTQMADLPQLELEPIRPVIKENKRNKENKEKKGFPLLLKTNLLYDALMTPNIGVEIPIKNNKWSLAGNWMYGWWKNNHRHRYWRIYGGDLELRYWLAKEAKLKPLRGHHLGVYGQIVTYDFEFGDRGYLGDKWSYAFGVSYGYSHPIGRRLNLDYTIGFGYFGGKYKEYIPQDHCYVWQATKQRHMFCPTKIEVSLVWLIGRNNVNKEKGGMR